MLPILYQNHDLIIYSYPLFMGLGWGIAYQVFFAKTDLAPLTAQILFWGLFVSSWIGSKLFFYFTSDSLIQKTLLAEASFWTGGGFVFYGGLIFGLVFLGIYKLFKCPISLQTLWAILPALTLGHAIGRIGCLLAGCCFGSITDLWWGIELHGAHRHPTQALESVGLFLLAILLLKSKASLRPLALYFIGYGLLRFVSELLRGDEIRGQWGPLTPSQWISLILIMSGVMLAYICKYSRLYASKVK